MGKAALSVPQVLDKLESFHGHQEPCWPVDPYLFLVWWHCGYPASDAACGKGWEALNREAGTSQQQLLATPVPKLAQALKPGGMVPELRAMRLKEIASRIQNELGGDLRAALTGPLNEIRKTLKKFPNIGDPGADRIMLFADIAPLAAVPSNCVHVLVRILHGRERENYGTNYREAHVAIDAETPATFDSRKRAYLLLKKHGQELCKRTNPKCERCPVNSFCAYFAGHSRGGAKMATKRKAAKQQ